MEPTPTFFEPLVTQVNAVPEGRDRWTDLAAQDATESGPELPQNLGALMQAGTELRRMLLFSLLLSFLSLVELTTLLLLPSAEPLVVWEERSLKPLVEVP